MAYTLYFGNDQKNVQMLQYYYAELKKETGELGNVTHVTNETQIAEALIAMSFECVVMEQKLIPELPTEWIRNFKKTRPAIKSKFILIGDEMDQLRILTYLEAGWTDYIYTPVDRPLLFEKITLYSTGTRSQNKQVYSLKLNESADIAKPGVIQELSEFDCKIKATYATEVNQLMIVYTKAIGEGNARVGSALCRCYKTEPHPNAEGYFLNSYNFVGVAPEVLQNIRTSLRKTYISSKGN